MNPFIDRNQLRREQALFRYMLALERGDDVTLDAILQQAESDGILEDMIFAWHAEEAEAMDALVFAHDAQTVHRLAADHLVTGTAEEISDPPPVTVGDVAAHVLSEMQTDQHGQRFAADVAAEAAPLVASTTPLPAKLSLGALQGFFADLNLPVSSQFLKRFRNTAISLAMGRERAINVAAARRQGPRKPQPKGPEA